jgi:hypothetical protein|nr:MAG TPA: hypothetical protein [Caudoviricetes sp.]
MNKPRVEIHSQGPEGNIYFIIGKARDALRKARRISDYNDMWERVQNCGSYTTALAEIRKTVDLIDLDGAF